MNPTVESAIANLSRVSTVEDVADLTTLETALALILPLSDLGPALPALFGLFERFPEDDAYGLFWSILHRIEKEPGYEAQLIASLQRRPSIFALRMAWGLIAAGANEFQGQDLLLIVRAIASSSESATIRQYSEKPGAVEGGPCYPEEGPRSH